MAATEFLNCKPGDDLASRARHVARLVYKRRALAPFADVAVVMREAIDRSGGLMPATPLHSDATTIPGSGIAVVDVRILTNPGGATFADLAEKAGDLTSEMALVSVAYVGPVPSGGATELARGRGDALAAAQADPDNASALDKLTRTAGKIGTTAAQVSSAVLIVAALGLAAYLLSRSRSA